MDPEGVRRVVRLADFVVSLRLKADILCLQEVNGQETAGGPRRLMALGRLIEGTLYADCLS